VAIIPAPETTSTVAQIYRSYEKREALSGGNRPHLGASLIGHLCERYLWLMFRWVGAEAFDGRMLRLFNTGHRAEARFVDELREIGATVWDTDEFGAQQRVSALGGHFGGSMDAVAQGLPEAPKTPHVVEFKTHSQKSFDELVKKKVRAAKPQHWAQMQVYMGLAELDRAMYLAENKNTSEVYAERVEFDLVEFTSLMERARRVITSGEPPARLSEDPAWFECKWCSFREHCHGERLPAVNCRTCAHSTPLVDSEGASWQCELTKTPIGLDVQPSGCNGHRFIPVLLARVAQQTDAVDERDGNLAVTYTLADGSTFANGYPPAFSSIEIRATHHASMLGDSQVQAIKAEFPQARMVA